MFNSGSYEKGCATAMPDNSFSPGHSNNSARFSVGLTPIGDENQQIRIQLAVNKYNNSPQGLGINRRGVPLPVKQTFFAYERNGDLAGKSEKKLENRYEGVGNFPTVHLRKSAVRYRPIRKFSNVKVPYPELPVNRFLNHLPELCTENKSSTRSVLDVLQDMSRKKINSQDEIDYIRYSSRGLGGDLAVSGEVIPRPLFVKQSRGNVVSTRDNTTQTLFPQNLEQSVPTTSTSSAKSDNCDPRAELRKKLAKQNNEIFASLSSSNISFVLKRKIDKISTAKHDKSGGDFSTGKKAKIQAESQTTFGTVPHTKLINGVRGNSGKESSSTKVTRRSKPGDAGITTSPNKDRLTTIFLDMEGSPKTHIFRNSGKSSGSVWEEPNKDSSCTNTVATNGETDIITQNRLLEPKTNSTDNTQSNCMSSNSLAFTKSTSPSQIIPVTNTNTDSSNLVNNNNDLKGNETSSNQFKFEPMNKTSSTSEMSKSSRDWALTPETAANITVSVCRTSADASNASKTVTVNSSNNNPSLISSSFSSEPSGKTKQSPEFKPSKSPNEFDVTSSLKSNAGASSIALTFSAAEATATTAIKNTTTLFTITTNTAPQFKFGLSDSCATSKSVTLPIVSSATLCQPVSSSSGLTGITANPMFTFGQNSTTPQATNTVNLEGKSEVSKAGFMFGASSENLPITTTSKAQGTSTETSSGTSNIAKISDTVQNVASSPFTFGQKPVDTHTDQNKSVPDVTQTKTSTFEPTTTNSGSLQSVFTNFQTPTTTTVVTSEGSGQTTAISQGNLFLFGKKTTSNASQMGSSVFPTSFGQTTTSTEGTSKPYDSVSVSSPGTFTFGQTPAASASPAVPSSSISSDQNAQQKVFTFGQTPSTKPSLLSGFGTTNQTTAFGQGTSLFGQNTSPTSTTSSSGFDGNQPSTMKPKSSFDAKPGSISFGSVPNSSIFGQSQGTSSVGANAGAFGTPAGFGTPTTQSGVQFGGSAFSATGITGFGANVTTHSSTLTFGTPKTTETNLSFGSSTTTGFVSTTSTSQSVPCGATVTTQPTGGFNAPFGQMNKPTSKSNLFDQTTLVQSSTSAFTSPTSTSFGVNGSQNIFGAKTNTGQDSIFGQPQKLQTPAFGGGSTGQSSFGTQNKFTFGSTTSNVTSFTASPPKTTSAGVFTFGAATTTTTATNLGSASSFGSTGAATGSSTASTPFSFTGQNATTPAFTFGAQINNNPLEAKPTTAPGGSFNFTTGQAPAQSAFNFNATCQTVQHSPSVFSFGSSGSGSSGSTFNFGTPQPGGPFSQGTPSPGTFSAPGTFSIGSGSSTQSRPRASSRLRRRP